MNELEVVRKVADGSAVEAFLARAGDEQVVVQVSRPEIANDPEFYGRFLDFARTATQLNHPALLGAQRTHCGSDGRFTVVSAPVSGRTAEGYLADHGVLSTEEAARWGLSLCDALEYLHAHGVVHGNLSPSHVFLDGDPKRPDVRLLDTGFLLFRAARSLSISKVLVRPEYLSPERVTGIRATPSSDIYGLGVLLYELLVGAPPFKTRELHLSAATPLLPASLVPWQVLFDGCFTRDPALRFPSVAALRGALQSVVALPSEIVAGRELDETSVIEGRIESSAPRGEVKVGDILGNYEILSLLGEGGMGKVYLAEHLSLGRRVALKVLRPEMGRHPELVQRFVQEARAVNRSRHPHIVEVFDLVQEPGRTWFVMELLEGRSLREIGKEAPIPVRETVRHVRQAADALAAAHAVGVVHRDVKPDNLFVTAAGVKVLDFGVARVRDQQRLVPRTTQVGQVVGTPLWMSPEQVLGHDVDAKADVYSLATVLYVMLLRRFPFEGATMSDIVLQRLRRDPTPIAAQSVGGELIPGGLRRLVDRALNRDAAARPTMTEFGAGLHEFELEPFADSIDFESIPPPRRRWPWVVTGGMAVLGAAAWFAVRHLH